MKAYEKQRGAGREKQKELQRAAAQDPAGELPGEGGGESRPLDPFTPKAALGNYPGDAPQAKTRTERCPASGSRR